MKDSRKVNAVTFAVEEDDVVMRDEQDVITDGKLEERYGHVHTDVELLGDQELCYRFVSMVSIAADD